MSASSWPLVYRLVQHWDQPEITDVAEAVRQAILSSRLPQRLRPGSRVALAVGSRGIAHLAEMAGSALRTLRELGAEPFVVAAMGSHGGATPEGQRELLASYGITESGLGVPVRTDMEVVEIGRNSWGEPVYWDRHAYEADAVITLSRIKPHTDFRGRYESGVVKMLVIGLGKRRGAETHHKYGVRGLRDMIPESAKVVLARTRFALGLAILENARERTAHIVPLEPEEVLEREPALLEQARRLLPRIPFRQLDLLVVGELGKNYSGTGMDVNVLGRQLVEGERDSLDPCITRICVLDVSEESHGNAVGVGLADLTTQRLLNKMNRHITDVNALTSCFLLRTKIPHALANDRECILTGLNTCWQPHRERVRLAIIPNTLQLETMYVSAPLVEEVRQRQLARELPEDLRLEIADAPTPLPFDEQGNLIQEVLFPESIRAQRNRGFRCAV
ncbi:MAG: lactate racemase domain-containing protein [Gemmatales bacterium]|nr:nickel-dependent lactate racemase [Gemmatales bacterium]MCS7160606.1 nickel-dependent lactate racemase [Gemmatales bacterium]MDW8175807.1 lactate racemase domain-containing protein [Gemmatales bacterium]MDW8221887.1 lactate racemase domain-containing protein [Gemmatales bacterium]